MYTGLDLKKYLNDLGTQIPLKNHVPQQNKNKTEQQFIDFSRAPLIYAGW